MHCRTSSNTLKRLCRVCLQLPEEDNKLDLTIIYDEEESFTYGQCFTICTRIHLDDPHLPQNLCKSCGLELQMSYDFKKKVEESSRSLEQYQQHIEKVKCMKRKDSEEPNEWQSEHSLEDSSNFVSTHESEQPNVDICVDTTKDFQIFNTEDQESYTVVSGPTSNNERIIDGDLVDEEEDGQDINIENISQVDENLVEEEHLYIEDFDHVEALDDAGN